MIIVRRSILKENRIGCYALLGSVTRHSSQLLFLGTLLWIGSSCKSPDQSFRSISWSIDTLQISDTLYLGSRKELGSLSDFAPSDSGLLLLSDIGNQAGLHRVVVIKGKPQVRKIATGHLKNPFEAQAYYWCYSKGSLMEFQPGDSEILCVSSSPGSTYSFTIPLPKRVYSYTRISFRRANTIGDKVYLPLVDDNRFFGPVDSQSVCIEIDPAHRSHRILKVPVGWVPCGSNSCNISFSTQASDTLYLHQGCGTSRIVWVPKSGTVRKEEYTSPFVLPIAGDCERVRGVDLDFQNGFRWDVTRLESRDYEFTQLTKRIRNLGGQNRRIRLISEITVDPSSSRSIHQFTGAEGDFLLLQPWKQGFILIKEKGDSIAIVRYTGSKGREYEPEAWLSQLGTSTDSTIAGYLKSQKVDADLVIWFPYSYSCMTCRDAWLHHLMKYEGKERLVLITDKTISSPNDRLRILHNPDFGDTYFPNPPLNPVVLKRSGKDYIPINSPSLIEVNLVLDSLLGR